VVSGGFIAPALAPDGERVAFTRPEFDVLLVAELHGESAPRVVSRRSRAGYRPVWRADGEALGLRPADEPFGTGALEAVALDGRPLGPLTPDARWRAAQKDDCIFLLSGSTSRVVACGGGDRYFAPQLGGDGRHLVYCGLTSGLHLHRPGDRRTVSLGPGHQPAISADGRLLVFTRTEDDGERLTGAELWITDLTDPDYRTARLTRTPELEQHPSLSRDGSVLSYSAGGAIYTARLEITLPR
jgi:Tol biopolymer transport system component